LFPEQLKELKNLSGIIFQIELILFKKKLIVQNTHTALDLKIFLQKLATDKIKIKNCVMNCLVN